MAIYFDQNNKIAFNAIDKVLNSYVFTPTYGALYNYYALTNLAPTGWHVPTETDYIALYTTLGGINGYNTAGGHLKEIGTTHWTTPNTGADNTSNMSLLPNGLRSADGTFTNLNSSAFIWLSGTTAYSDYNMFNVEYNNDDSYLYISATIKMGAGVRMIKNDSSNPTTITDQDGNIYECVTVGSQVWTKQNWKCTRYNSGSPITIVTLAATWAAATSEAMCVYNNDWGNI